MHQLRNLIKIYERIIVINQSINVYNSIEILHIKSKRFGHSENPLGFTIPVQRMIFYQNSLRLKI